MTRGDADSRWEVPRRVTRCTAANEMVPSGRVQAVLYDGEVEFSADVDLATRRGRVASDIEELSRRSALIDLLTTRSRYLVTTTTGREALRREMLSTVNRILGGSRATEVRLPRFDLL